TLGKQKDLARFRRAVAFLRDEAAARKLFDVLGPRYADRPGGYSRVVRLPKHRIGDGAPRAILELVDNDVLARALEGADEDAGTGDWSRSLPRAGPRLSVAALQRRTSSRFSGPTRVARSSIRSSSTVTEKRESARTRCTTSPSWISNSSRWLPLLRS